MAKKYTKKIGKIMPEIASRHKLTELSGRDIIQSLDFYCHIAKHVKEFKSVENYETALQNIPNILINPEFTFYDKQHESILYYGKIDEITCYVVKLNLKDDHCYLASLYPVSLKKLERKKEESYIKN